MQNKLLYQPHLKFKLEIEINFDLAIKYVPNEYIYIFEAGKALLHHNELRTQAVA